MNRRRASPFGSLPWRTNLSATRPPPGAHAGRPSWGKTPSVARDFFVATWAEADELGPLPYGAALSVLHGVREEDMAAALASRSRTSRHPSHSQSRGRDFRSPLQPSEPK